MVPPSWRRWLNVLSRPAAGVRRHPAGRPRLSLEHLEDRLAPAGVALTYGGPGTELALNDLGPARNTVRISEDSPNKLTIDLNGAFFDGSSTLPGNGLTYNNGLPIASTVAFVNISALNKITTLRANLGVAGDVLLLGAIADSAGGVGDLVGSATTVNVA